MRIASLLTAFVLMLSACSGGEQNRQDPADTRPDAPADTANGGEEVPDDETEPDTQLSDAAPWSRDALARSEVPQVYVTEWEAADNRSSCALIAPASLGRGEEADARAAEFSGGWGIAYDTPNLRSAFGVAGTGAEPSDDTYDEWPNRHRWSDGSTVGYGPEGGSGSNDLAYLTIDGQDCLYNVWSRLGLDHLEYLLNELRFVE